MHEPLTAPAWVDLSAYPFRTKTFASSDGRMSYVDEGSGPPVLLVHGTPTWSFLWRRLIRTLSKSHRVIAPDHLGFGLSDKPPGAPYRPEDHARRLGELADALGLHNAALVVHDFGGPIGLSYALRHHDTVPAVVLFNTWMWSKEGDAKLVRASKLLGGHLGRFLYLRLNLSARVLLPAFFAQKERLTKELHAQYLKPFPSPRDRHAPAALARELIGSSEWYASLWAQREKLRRIPALLLWGERDAGFGMEDLARWKKAMPHAQVETYPEAGHFVQEEAPTSADSAAAFLCATLNATDVAR